MRYRKYGNKTIESDGHRFDSKREYARYCELKLLERAGEISCLDIHPSWELVVNGTRIGRYTADFAYRNKSGKLIVEDVKGVRTRDYVLRRKLMYALYGIDIVEI